MSRKRVYDLPTRAFHWMFAGLFLSAFFIAKNIDDESPVFTWHMMFGLTLGFLIFLRIGWGLIGTRHARFSGFALSPRELAGYFLGIVRGSQRKWAGHNPASSWAALAMMVCGLGLVFSGYNMTSGPNKEDFEDFHELFANGFLLLVLGHFLGIFIHTLRHKELIGLSMVDGKKNDVAESEIVDSQKPLAATVMVMVVAVFGFYLNQNYDSKTGALKIMGATLQLSEGQREVDRETESQEDIHDRAQ